MKKSEEESLFVDKIQHIPFQNRNILLYFFRLHREATTKKNRENKEKFCIRRDNELDILKAETEKCDKELQNNFWTIIEENGVLPLDSEWMV